MALNPTLTDIGIFTNKPLEFLAPTGRAVCVCDQQIYDFRTVFALW